VVLGLAFWPERAPIMSSGPIFRSAWPVGVAGKAETSNRQTGNREKTNRCRSVKRNWPASTRG